MPSQITTNADKTVSGRALNIHLGRDLKARWQTYCASLGKTPGAAIREAVEAQLSKSSASSAAVRRPPKRQAGESPDEGRKARIELRLTPSENSSIHEMAQAERCSPQQWIVNVVRATITRQPQFGIRELEALGESNYQLLSIGRNLNQIAKRMNERRPDTLPEKEIEKLRSIIKKHTETVSKVMRASLERWSIE
ncbi:MAG: plasmid mobilization relaxosome protein MobC [Candidatus Accumulibacter sp.]|jgi:predicted DNA-binding protein|nr:plasmid mobilization relaxosome protein MobC [Accumulibacter sp.]